MSNCDTSEFQDLQINASNLEHAPPTDVVEATKLYVDMGFFPIPVKPKSKEPANSGWQTYTCPAEQIEAHFSGGKNIALHLGRSGLADNDLDCPEAVALASYFLPESCCVFGHESNPDSHYVYAVEENLKRIPFSFENEVLVEYRAGNNTTVFPPSVHESGEPIVFQNGKAGVPSPADAGELLECLKLLAVAVVLVREWPKESGVRQEIALAVAGGLAHAGVPEAKARNLVLRVAKFAGDEEAPKRAEAVKSTYGKVKNEHLVGWTKLSELLGDGGPLVVATFRKWLDPVENVSKERLLPAEILLSTKELLDLDIPEREAVVSPWMMKGSVTLVFSAPKVGKTWFCMQLASDLVSASVDEFLKWSVPKSRRVLMVDGEMTLGEMKERTEKIVTDSEDRLTILPAQCLYEAGERELNLCDKNDQLWIEEAIDFCQADVVIFDTLSSLTVGRDENDNSSPELESLLNWLKRLRYQRLAVVLMHHSGHGGNHPRGASKIEGAVDTVVMLSSANGAGEFTISFPKHRGPTPDPEVLTVGLKDLGVTSQQVVQVLHW